MVGKLPTIDDSFCRSLCSPSPFAARCSRMIAIARFEPSRPPYFLGIPKRRKPALSARRRISARRSSHSLRGTPPFSKSVRSYSRRWSKKRMLSSCISSGLISASIKSSRSFNSVWMSCGISKSMGCSLRYLVRAGDSHLIHDGLPEVWQQPRLRLAVEIPAADPLRQRGVAFAQPRRESRLALRHALVADQPVQPLPLYPHEPVLQLQLSFDDADGVRRNLELESLPAIASVLGAIAHEAAERLQQLRRRRSILHR